MSIPCSYDLKYLPSLSAKEAECVVEWINSDQWRDKKQASSENPYYVVPNSTYENECYDLITDSNEIPILMAAYEDCGISGHASKKYPTKSGVTRTDQLL